MLGLGIAFTRNMFGSLEDQLMRNVDYENIPNPTNSEPISFESTRIYVDANSITAVGLKAVNPLVDSANFSINHSNCDAYHGDQFEQFEVSSGEVFEDAIIIEGASSPGSIDRCNLIFSFNSTDGGNNRTVRRTLQIYTE